MFKESNKILLSVLAAFILLLFISCSKDKPTHHTAPSTVTDIDGNVYRTVTIGTQVWMAENLKVTHYRNGDSIPNVTDSITWENFASGAFCNYDNDTANVAVYGRLYNWFAIEDNHNIAPTGWHVPSDSEWQVLIDYLGGDSVAGGKMKEAGTAHWGIPNVGATNESGFTGLPGGARGYYAQCLNMSSYGYFWSSTPAVNLKAWYFRLNGGNSSTLLDSEAYRRFGCSVRCVKD